MIRRSKRVRIWPAPQFSIDLTGQTALVTCAAARLGRRFAQVLAAAGASVAIAAHRNDPVAPFVDEIERAGGKAVAIELDATDAEQLISSVDQAEQALGPVTILMNNASIATPAAAIDMPVELIDTAIATDLRAPYILSCEFARRLIHARLPGRIVNVASMAAYHCDDSGVSVHSMTSAGLIRMTETLAVEWAKFNINVNAIASGFVHSDKAEVAFEHNPRFPDRFARRRMGGVEQLDSSLLYLVSPSSSFVTGTCIKVDDARLPR
jgi:NAD(P)-dependent dehydrogenase (short-subunit alcohol dehydrogenase family)